MYSGDNGYDDGPGGDSGSSGNGATGGGGVGAGGGDGGLVPVAPSDGIVGKRENDGRRGAGFCIFASSQDFPAEDGIVYIMLGSGQELASGEPLSFEEQSSDAQGSTDGLVIVEAGCLARMVVGSTLVHIIPPSVEPEAHQCLSTVLQQQQARQQPHASQMAPPPP